MGDTVKKKVLPRIPIKSWPEGERPREKLARFGPRFLTDAELLALLIESGTIGVSALDLAKQLLVEHRSLSVLATKNVPDLMRFRGIGIARASRLVAGFEAGRRSGIPQCGKSPKIATPDDMARLFIPEFQGLQSEMFKVVLLDSGNRIIRHVTISQGILNASVVHPREVFKAAIDGLAAGVVLLHNHPSGEAHPSGEDRRITAQLVKAGEVLGIPVVDHIILAHDAFFSFAREGLLNR